MSKLKSLKLKKIDIEDPKILDNLDKNIEVLCVGTIKGEYTNREKLELEFFNLRKFQGDFEHKHKFNYSFLPKCEKYKDGNVKVKSFKNSKGVNDDDSVQSYGLLWYSYKDVNLF